MRSLRARVLLSAAAILALFILFTGIALERAFRDSARAAREERLLGQLYLLMAAAEAEGGQLFLPDELAEARFSMPASGLYAAVLDDAGNALWRSGSALGIQAPLDGPLPPGEQRFELRHDPPGRDYFVNRFGVTWAIGPEPVAYTFAVAEDLAQYYRELARFRRSLAGWLGAMALLMLGALLLALRWGLAPLRQVAGEVAAVESGDRERIQGTYPAELRALTGNLNALLAHERAQQKRLSNALGDLAHSLKTPLAIIHGAVQPERLDPETAELMREQLARMDHIVEYQLQRARARAGAVAGLAPPLAIRRLVERVGASLAKVHRDKRRELELHIDAGLTFRGVEGDLMEIVGNLLDNAYKWARRRVRVSARGHLRSLQILVEDDGPGIPPAEARRVLERGARADQATPGHGIGLAVVREICEAYGGGVAIAESPLGGARVQARIGV